MSIQAKWLLCALALNSHYLCTVQFAGTTGAVAAVKMCAEQQSRENLWS